MNSVRMLVKWGDRKYFQENISCKLGQNIRCYLGKYLLQACPKHTMLFRKIFAASMPKTCVCGQYHSQLQPGLQPLKNRYF